MTLRFFRDFSQWRLKKKFPLSTLCSDHLAQADVIIVAGRCVPGRGVA